MITGAVEFWKKYGHGWPICDNARSANLPGPCVLPAVLWSYETVDSTKPTARCCFHAQDQALPFGVWVEKENATR